MPVVLRGTPGCAKVLSTLPSLDLVLELELVAVSPRTWEPSFLVPPAKSGLLK